MHIKYKRYSHILVKIHNKYKRYTFNNIVPYDHIFQPLWENNRNGLNFETQ